MSVDRQNPNIVIDSEGTNDAMQATTDTGVNPRTIMEYWRHAGATRAAATKVVVEQHRTEEAKFPQSEQN